MEDTYQTKEGFVKSMILFIVLLGICFAPFFAFSQIPTRIITNPGFESPATGCSSSYNFIEQVNMGGWKTEDSLYAPLVTCGSGGASRPYLIEVWTNGMGSINGHTGSQFAEINGSNATFLYQDICLLANEVVPFSVWHIRRAGSGNGEQMVAELKQNATTTIATGATHTATGSWTNYTGTLTNNGTAGMRRYGFRAISGGSMGNLIDDISISLKPLVDIRSFSFTNVYESANNSLNLYVNGTLLGAATVTISKSGSATYLSDYTIGTPNRGSRTVNSAGDIVLTLPAGDYNPNLSTGSTAGFITIPYTVINEGVYEANETVIYTVTGSANGGNGNAAFNLATGINGQSAACVATVATASFTIIDAVALPVKLIAFKAEKEVGFNQIAWTVAEEDNLRKYILEFSINGNDYYHLADIQYDPNNQLNYAYTHQIAEHANVSYRLKTEDFEGNISDLGDPVSLSRNINTTFSVFPNPNNGNFTANFYSQREMQTELILCDQVGKKISVVQVQAVKGDNSVSFDVEQPLPTGIYYIMYTYGEQTKSIRINIVR
jgi:hypothetical protein